MRAWGMKAVEDLRRDFEATPGAAGHLEVYAAYGLRHVRQGSVWMLFVANEMAVYEGGYGDNDAFHSALMRLDEEFPERRWTKWMRHLRERRETDDQGCADD